VDTIFLAEVLVIAASRAVVIADFLRRCWANGRRNGPAFVWTLVNGTAGHHLGLSAGDHELVVDEEAKNVETMFLVGSIALAAWSQIYVSSAGAPANRLTG